MTNDNSEYSGQDIAIIGMSGKFPGANSVEQYWANLMSGNECVTKFTDEQLINAGIDKNTLEKSNYVKCGAVLKNVDKFDAKFFGFTPREAEVMDPQFRLFLECSWEALERACCDPDNYNGRIGVYAGAGTNSYLTKNLLNNESLELLTTDFEIGITNDKDFLPTWVSYCLSLKGPSIAINTACSTSLVTVHMACQALINYETDIALSGGVSIKVPQVEGYLYKDGGILSPDGSCRPFDEKSEGTIAGSGLGIVVLKRLDDAVKDRDHIHAVIRSSAVNNDGALKVGFTAPSVNGQARVVAEALAVAEVEPDSVGYIETHGTATALGDPIEIDALKQVFGNQPKNGTSCYLGSVKSNIGHLDAAAGIAGLIKAAMVIENRAIPPTLHFNVPNKGIDFENSPFEVVTTVKNLTQKNGRFVAGVSSFGIGGTNAHAILCDAPNVLPATKSRECHILSISAKTKSALSKMKENLYDYLVNNTTSNLEDVSYTLHIGRTDFNHRMFVTCKTKEDAIKNLSENEVPDYFCERSESVVFMFPGQGSQYKNMAKGLYSNEPEFKKWLNKCADILEPHVKLNIIDILYPTSDLDVNIDEQLTKTLYAQPVIFAIEYSLAKMYMAWGVIPQSMIGHSLGEFVVACLSGVIELKDALYLVAMRGKISQESPQGSMISVSLGLDSLEDYLDGTLAIAAINAPSATVLSGDDESVTALREKLTLDRIRCDKLRTSNAFHSPMMNAAADELLEILKTIKFSVPKIPYISNVTGAWVNETEVVKPDYWLKHMKETVMFSQGVDTLIDSGNKIFIEMGPGTALSGLVKSHDVPDNVVSLASMRHLKSSINDNMHLANTLAQLWGAGVKIDWEAYYSHEKRNKLILPTYPFEHKSYWINNKNIGNKLSRRIEKNSDQSEWLYSPVWKRSLVNYSGDYQQAVKSQKNDWLLFLNRDQLGKEITELLRSHSHRAVVVYAGDSQLKLDDYCYQINPNIESDYSGLIEMLRVDQYTPDRIVHMWSTADAEKCEKGVDCFNKSQVNGFHSLLNIVRSLNHKVTDELLKMFVFSTGTCDVTGNDYVSPEKVTIVGACRVISQEYPSIDVCHTNIECIENGVLNNQIMHIIREIFLETDQNLSAYRNNYRWIQDCDPIKSEPGNSLSDIRNDGVYIITGGLGAIGMTIAEFLSETANSNVILVSRSGLPERKYWDESLEDKSMSQSDKSKLQRIINMENNGANISTYKADVSDLLQMNKLVSSVLSEYGKINGVFYAAGPSEADSFVDIKDTNISNSELCFKPKAYGMYALEESLEGLDIDFCYIISSLSSILGGIGFCSYTAANLFQDAFTNAHNLNSKQKWLSINFDAWSFDSMDSVTTSKSSDLASYALKPDEGVSVFKRLLKSNQHGQIVVSTGLLNERVKKSFGNKSIDTQSYKNEKSENSISDMPRNEIEKEVSVLWEKLFGLSFINIHSDFFELGGHSLLAVNLVNAANECFNIDISLDSLFEAPTIAGMSLSVIEYITDDINDDDLEMMLDGIK